MRCDSSSEAVRLLEGTDRSDGRRWCVPALPEVLVELVFGREGSTVAIVYFVFVSAS